MPSTSNQLKQWSVLVLLISVALLAGLGSVKWRSVQSSLKAVEDSVRLERKLPHLGNQKEYVSSDRCQACHPSQFESWHRTFHRTMTQTATPENVVGDFDGSSVQSHNLSYRVFRKDNEFWADMPDPDVMMYVMQGGKKLALGQIPRVEQRVVMATGSHHYQTYWVTSPRYDRVMQTLPLVYLIEDKRWIPREAAFMRPPHEGSGFITQWNHHCIRCHSTGGNPGLDPRTGMLDTRVAELGIACESCHGAGEDHVERNSNPLRRYSLHLTGQSDPTVVNPAKLDHRASSQVCGQCHGVFVMRDEFAMKFASEGELYRAGEDLNKTRYFIHYPKEGSPPQQWEELRRNPQFFAERWWEDGTILAGGREYTALAVSGCYTRGKISCLSCHSMHQSNPAGQLKMDIAGNASCTQCHGESKYTTRVEQHTFHAADSAGSDCLNCHMPHTTYALFRAIRTHQITSPTTAGSAKFGVPNACNLCHLDKTLAWTQQHLSERYGAKSQPLTEEQQSTAASLLWLLKGHAAQRAITAWHVGWQPAQRASGTNWLAPFQARLLTDPYGVVRYVAARSLRTLPGFGDFQYDFLGSESDLKQSVRKAAVQWQTHNTVTNRTGGEVLLDAKGRVMEERVHQLISERDDRTVIIME